MGLSRLAGSTSLLAAGSGGAMIDLEATSDVLGDGTLAASMAKTGSSSAATTGGLSPFAAGGLSLTATVLSAAAGLSGAACVVGAAEAAGATDGADAGVAGCAAGVSAGAGEAAGAALLCLAIAPVTESSPSSSVVTRE